MNRHPGFVRVIGVEAVDIRHQDQDIGFHQSRHNSGKPVVVAELDFIEFATVSFSLTMGIVPSFSDSLNVFAH